MLTLFFNHVDTTQESTTPGNLLIVDMRIDGDDSGMGIIGMQDHELLMLLGTSLRW